MTGAAHARRAGDRSRRRVRLPSIADKNAASVQSDSRQLATVVESDMICRAVACLVVVVIIALFTRRSSSLLAAAVSSHDDADDASRTKGKHTWIR